MRFRYFDSDGTEVEISSVDALKFRIGTGAVTPETLLYDAAVEKWAPAAHHQVFRFIVEDDEEVLPEDSRAMLEGMADAPADASAEQAPAPPRKKEAPSRPPREKSDERGLAERSLDLLGWSSPGEGHGEDAAPAASAPAEGSKKEEDPDPSAEESRKQEVPEASPEGSQDQEGPEVSPEGSPDHEVPEASPEGSQEHEGPKPSAEPEEPDPEPSPAPAVEEEVVEPSASAAPPPPAPRAGAGHRPSSDPRLEELDIPAALVGLLGDAPEEDLSGTGRAPSRSGRRLPRMRWLLVAVLVLTGGAAVLAFLVENGRDVLAADGAEPVMEHAAANFPNESGGAEEPPPDPTPDAVTGDDGDDGPLPAGELESLSSEVAGAVSWDLARAMAELQDALGVPEEPPSAWLQGAYLAAAHRHPEVREYWRAYGTFVTSVRALEEDLYRGFVQNRVLKMGLDTASAAELSARVLERYEGSAEKRRVVYEDLQALADEALALHDTLAARSDVITYEPFSGRTLSRDPVVEAVAEDPALARHIWVRLDGIFERLDRLQGLRPVSTMRLQEALLSGLRIPQREG